MTAPAEATLHLGGPLSAIVGDANPRLPLSRVKRELDRFGILPVTDPETPSLVSIVSGGPISGSWWGHPAGQLIYRVSEALDSEPEVVVVKLWRGKLTLVHRRLWPPLVRIGRARTGWQMAGLGPAPRRLLTHLDRTSTVRSDDPPPGFAFGSQDFRSAVRDLEQRLLVLTRSIHTETGAHALQAESWASWSAKSRTERYRASVTAAQLEIEDAARRVSPGSDPRRLFPWGAAKTHA